MTRNTAVAAPTAPTHQPAPTAPMHQAAPTAPTLQPAPTAPVRHAAPSAPADPSPAPPPPDRSVVLVGLMGAGKTSVGRRLAARLSLPFRDADAEIELAARASIPEIFERHGEAYFRDGERRVIRRLLDGPPVVLATGGGAFMDPRTRAAIRARAVSVWLRCELPVLVRRTAGRSNRPLLNAGEPADTLRRLVGLRHPTYAEADVIVDSGEEGAEGTTGAVLRALAAHRPPRRLPVPLGGGHDVLIGEGLLPRAGALLAPVLPSRRALVVTDERVAALHLPALLAGLAETGIHPRVLPVPPGESAKSLASYARLAEAALAPGPDGAVLDRGTAVIALGGGVVGDLAGFLAATLLRGLPFVQIPTTLLSQVDSSVGGKTGINAAGGKNLLGAFHQPRAVLADVSTLSTLPVRELRAGFAEVLKAGLISDPALFAWCERHAPALLAGDAALLAEAVERACAFKLSVVLGDEREERPEGGRALLNLGHTFAHAFESEFGFDGALLHGEAVGLGLVLAFALSARLGHCPADDAARVRAAVRAAGLPDSAAALPRPPSAATLLTNMARDKKARDGRLGFVLARGVGAAFTTRDVEGDAVLAVLREAGCAA